MAHRLTSDRSIRRVRVLRRASQAAGAVVVLVAGSALLGWRLNEPHLKSIVPGLIAMNPMTALRLIIYGLARSLLRKEPAADEPRAAHFGRRVAYSLAALVIAVGVLKLASYFPHGDVRIDTLLFPQKIDAEPIPNRMAPNSAGSFFLVGLGLLLLDVESRGRRPAQWIALGLVLTSLLALIGYAYRMALYAVPTFIPMALHTALCFMLLALGLLCARPDRGLMAVLTGDSPAGVIARRLLPAAAATPAILGWLRLLGQRYHLFDSEFGSSLVVVGNVLVITALVWWNLSLLQRAENKRQRTQAALTESEQRFRAVVEQTAEGIYLVDAETKAVLETNAAFRSLLGYTADELRALRVFDLVEDDPAAIEARLQKAISGATYVFGERRYRRKDGSLVEVEVSATVIDVGGRRVLCAVARDITERKRVERQLHEKNRQLEEAATSEREARQALMTAQGQMLQTEKLAALGQMVAGVAHEINNPLSFVGNNVAVLQRDLRAIVELLDLYRRGDRVLKEHDPDLLRQVRELSERVDLAYTVQNLHALLQRSREGLKRIQQIVKDLRDFARLDESELQEADLNAGVQSTVNIILGYAKRRQVRVETRLDPLPPVICYAAKINQVVMNLLSNAIDASPDGGKVMVRTSTSNGTARIEVSDEGSGINPMIVDRIFDPFFTTKPQGQGTGLGLSISYGIVQDHGGRIEVSSREGTGSTFSVSLPVKGKKQSEELAAKG